MSLSSSDNLAETATIQRGAERDCLVVETILPLALIVIGIKLGKVLFAYLEMDDLSVGLKSIYSSWLVRLTLVFIASLWAGKAFCPRRKWLVPGAAIVTLCLAKLAQVIWTGKVDNGYAWLVDAAQEVWPVLCCILNVLRADIVFLGSLGLIVFVALKLIPGRYYPILRVALNVCTGLLVLLSGLELAQYCKTGSMGSGHLLGFFIANASGLWSMVRSEFDFQAVASLLVPFIVCGATVFLVRRAYARTGRKHLPVQGILFGFFVPFIIAAEIFHLPMTDRRYVRFYDNTYLGLAELIPWRKAGEIEAEKQASRLPPVFDTAKATVESGAGARGRTNVIIILLESTRADSTSIYDSAIGSTPFLAEFAKRGAVIPDMYAVVPRTCAAWVAVLGGVWPSTDEEMSSCARKGRFPLKGLPAMLATRGYSTAFFSAAHLSFGYDAAVIKSMGFQFVRDADTLDNSGFERVSFWGYEDRIMVRPSIEWAKKQHDDQKPFLLVMMTDVGHYDYKYPAKWQTRDFGKSDKSYNNYLNCLGYVDSVLKDLMAQLDQMGVLDSSLVLIMGDHGESFGEHGPRLHSLELYEETVKIPAIFYAKGLVAPGTTITGLRQEVDVVPTVLDALGFSLEQGTLPGLSLLRPAPTDRSVYFSCALSSESLAMRTGRLKFVYNFSRSPTEVYALDQDPAERHDLSASLPRATIDDAEMKMMLWRARVSRAFGEPIYSHFTAN